MATTRVNKLDFGNNGTSFSFNGGVCDSAFVKVSNDSGGVGLVTYGGMSMAVLGFVTDTAGWTHQIWGLQNAPQGPVTIAITGTGTIISSVESYSGISTTAPFPNVSGTAEHHFGSGSLTSIQVDVITTVNDCILIGLGGYQGSGITFMQAGSNTTTISVNPLGGGTDLSFESSPLDVGVAGTYHLAGTTGGGSNSIVISLVVVALAPGPAATVSFIPQMLII